MVLTKIETCAICIYFFNLSFFFLVRAARQAGGGALWHLIEKLFSGSGGIQLEITESVLSEPPAFSNFLYWVSTHSGILDSPGLCISLITLRELLP